jgi:hypothetical protein
MPSDFRDWRGDFKRVSRFHPSPRRLGGMKKISTFGFSPWASCEIG